MSETTNEKVDNPPVGSKIEKLLIDKGFDENQVEVLLGLFTLDKIKFLEENLADLSTELEGLKPESITQERFIKILSSLENNKINKLVSIQQESKVKEQKVKVKEEQENTNKEQENMNLDEKNAKDIKIITDKKLEYENLNKFISLKNEILEKTKLNGDPKFEADKQEKKAQILKSNPNLSTPENAQKLEELSTGLAILSNSQKILETNPKLKTQLTQLSEIGQTIPEFKNIQIENRLQQAPNILKQEIEQVKSSFTATGEKLEISSKNASGKTIEFVSGDQKVIVSTESELPKKFIQKYGYSIETSQDYPINYEYLRKKQELQTPLERLKQEQKEENSNLDGLKIFQNKNREVSHQNIKDFSQISNALPNTNQFGELKTLVGDYNKDKQRIQELIKDKTINQTQKEIEIEGLQDLLNSYLEKINKAIQSLIQRINQRQEQLNQNVSQLNQLERDKEATNSNYTSKQLDKDNQARDTLEFLNLSGITVIKQSNFDKLATQINQNPTMYGLSTPIDLKEGFSGTVLNPNEGKQNFLNLFSKLYTAVGLGQILTVQDLNENPISKTDFKKGLIQKGFMSNGELKVDKVLSALSK